MDTVPITGEFGQPIIVDARFVGESPGLPVGLESCPERDPSVNVAFAELLQSRGRVTTDDLRKLESATAVAQGDAEVTQTLDTVPLCLMVCLCESGIPQSWPGIMYEKCPTHEAATLRSLLKAGWNIQIHVLNENGKVVPVKAN